MQSEFWSLCHQLYDEVVKDHFMSWTETSGCLVILPQQVGFGACHFQQQQQEQGKPLRRSARSDTASHGFLMT